MKQNEVSASILKALGHPLRIGIARKLLDGEMCVGHIVDHFKIHQANASQSLNVLRTHGIVKKQRRQNFIYYSLREPLKMQQILEVLESNGD